MTGMRVAPGRIVLDSYTLERANSVPGDDRPFVRIFFPLRMSQILAVAGLWESNVASNSPLGENATLKALGLASPNGWTSAPLAESQKRILFVGE
jgi:hypothetical protein